MLLPGSVWRLLLWLEPAWANESKSDCLDGTETCAGMGGSCPIHFLGVEAVLSNADTLQFVSQALLGQHTSYVWKQILSNADALQFVSQALLGQHISYVWNFHWQYSH